MTLLPPPPLSPEHVFLRLLPRLRFEDDCWLWTGATRGGQTRGPEEGRYGFVCWRVDGRRRAYYVHRLIRWCFHGDWPNVVDHAHACGRGICVNPRYLWAATERVNNRRAAAKTNGVHRLAYDAPVDLDPIW